MAKYGGHNWCFTNYYCSVNYTGEGIWGSILGVIASILGIFAGCTSSTKIFKWLYIAQATLVGYIISLDLKKNGI